MTEIDKIINDSTIAIFYKGDLMKFEFNDAMQMQLVTAPEESNFLLMKAMLEDATQAISGI